MPDEQQPDHVSGGVPHAYRNALYWRWTRGLPRPLRGGFLTVLYALATAANTSGVLRMRDGKAIRVQSVAAASCSDIKEVRVWLQAAVAAGVVTTEEPPGPGRPTVYVLVISPRPDWAAAVAVIEERKRRRPKKESAPWAEEAAPEMGGPAPHSEGPNRGDRPPNSPEGKWGDRPPLEMGGPAPLEMGGPAPQRPRVTQVLPQESAAVGGHLTLGVAPEELGEPPEVDEVDTTPTEADPFDTAPPPAPPRLALTTQERRDARAAEVKTKSASSRGQMPLLLSVRDPEHVATVADVRAAAETDPEAVRRAIRKLGRTEAIKVYGWRLVSPHLRDDTTATDTA
ncbi:hypothetical protein AW27_026480 [Streptomyces sp. PCS3-D2]|uniref:hypothetical protein n=1 Tax=Streptomyces sp. PCS3-D2 TaxID=1460244 RepID=UPI0004486877|nr:hypothetical protein [Streptomyces sp. PCS3-D2]WKV74249.1 hypothetical protein AW27_023695 [Streptomyces sp. PCS3-D2]WKV74755.1 hypothetical protein AW27_026480 [Streptomyces sp. PCS3-D2]